MVFETNNIKSAGIDHMIPRRVVYWTEPGLKITRLRLLSDPGYPAWDVSYCYGVLQGGEQVQVSLPFSELPKRGFKRAIVAYAKKERVFAAGLGILDDSVISLLC